MNPSKHCQICFLFFLIAKKSNLFNLCGKISILYATCCASDALNSFGRRLKNGQLSGFPDILSPSISNLCAALPSKLKLKSTTRTTLRGYVR